MMRLTVSSKGIGDAVCGLYAACGAANAGNNVEYVTRHAAWLQRAHNPRLTVIEGGGDGLDLYAGYHAHLAAGTDRKQAYCDNIGPGLKPWWPFMVDRTIRNLRHRTTAARGYVVLSPFSAWADRQWIPPHWRQLTGLLFAAGFESVIIDGRTSAGRIAEIFQPLPREWRKWYWGQTPDAVCDLMLGAAGYIGLDSGMTHVAGLLGVPAVAIMAQLPANLVFSHTKVAGVPSRTSCSGCRWQPERGYQQWCHNGCSALWAISPDDVLATFEQLVQ